MCEDVKIRHSAVYCLSIFSDPSTPVMKMHPNNRLCTCLHSCSDAFLELSTVNYECLLSPRGLQMNCNEIKDLDLAHPHKGKVREMVP